MGKCACKHGGMYMEVEQAGLAICVVACLVSGTYLSILVVQAWMRRRRSTMIYSTTATSSAAEGRHRAKQARQRQGMGLLLHGRVLWGLEWFCCVLCMFHNLNGSRV